MEKAYLLITGEKIKGYSSLRRLAKEIGVDPHGLKKESLPFQSGRLKIVEVEIDTRL